MFEDAKVGAARLIKKGILFFAALVILIIFLRDPGGFISAIWNMGATILSWANSVADWVEGFLNRWE